MEKAVRSKKKQQKRRRPPRSTLALRWLAVAGLALIALLYYQPFKTYLAKRHEVAQRTADVRSLRAANRFLRRRVADSDGPAAVARQARRIGFVKPGERLFIVKGITAWQHARTTIERGGR
ncbi:MAG: septum formation initiator family protein [Actinomycetota bacterium]|nr:septum formation initiator family protein [Actinomycetota bacterium]